MWIFRTQILVDFMRGKLYAGYSQNCSVWRIAAFCMYQVSLSLTLYIYIYIQGVSKWLERFQSAITTFKTYTEVSFPYRMKQQVFKFCTHAQSHSPLLSRSVTEQNDNDDSGAKSVLCTAICEEWIRFFLFCGHSGDNSRVIGMCHKLVEFLFHFY